MLIANNVDSARSRKKTTRLPNLEFIGVDEGIITQAQSLMDKYNLSPRDSIHVASALSRKATIIISDDEDFDQIKEIKEPRQNRA